MNCLDFRRNSLSDPNHLDSDMSEHVASCEACSHYLEEIESLDQSIEKAFNVEVSDDLAARILLNQTLTPRSKSRVAVRYAAAASIMVALFMGIYSLSLTSIGEKSLQHVLDEPEALALKESYTQEEIVTTLAKFDLELSGRLDNVVHMGTCVIDKKLSIHMVVEKDNELVTVLVLPGEQVDSSESFTKGAWVSSVVPFYDGSLAIVQASGGRMIDSVEAMFRNKLIQRADGSSTVQGVEEKTGNSRRVSYL